MRRARKVDGNQAEIVAALRAAGRGVVVLSDVGRGIPDLMVHWSGRCIWMEVKRPGEKLTPDQVEWHRHWKGPAVAVVRSAAEALQATGVGTK
jgi:hypothetical protein